ncbi:MAG: alpha/beta hydrolase [Melioribacteraceae bacterium]|nr:alpha/beta hydrolase [Melioribacteraceae bacterium]
MKTPKQFSTILSTTLVIIIFFITLTKAETISFDSFDATVTGEGNPIVFIHGYASGKSVWDETVDYLKSDFQCHVIQIAGFAGRDPIKVESFLSKLKDDIAEYIKDNNLKKVIIVGHSMGGFLALWLASEYPDLVSKVVSVDGVPYLSAIVNPDVTPESQMNFAKQSFNYENDFAQRENAITDEQLKQMFITMTIHEDKIPVLLEWTKKSDTRTLNQTMFEMMTTDIRENVKNIKVPVLVLGAWIAYKGYGATKESTLKLYELQFQNVNNCKITLTNKGKHFIMWDDFEWYSSTIKEFLQKQTNKL